MLEKFPIKRIETRLKMELKLSPTQLCNSSHSLYNSINDRKWDKNYVQKFKRCANFLTAFAYGWKAKFKRRISHNNCPTSPKDFDTFHGVL